MASKYTRTSKDIPKVSKSTLDRFDKSALYVLSNLNNYDKNNKTSYTKRIAKKFDEIRKIIRK